MFEYYKHSSRDDCAPSKATATCMTSKLAPAKKQEIGLPPLILGFLAPALCRKQFAPLGLCYTSKQAYTETLLFFHCLTPQFNQMANRLRMKSALSFIAFLAIFFTSCNKSSLTDSVTPATPGTTTTAMTVAARLTGIAGDSLCLLHQLHNGYQRVAVAESALPAAIGTYLTANYSGYTFSKAFSVNDTTGTAVAYLVVVYYNNKPVGLQFDAAGAFVQVLEQRERGDMNGDGHGGRFHDRDGKHRDTVALSTLPASVLMYMSTNYPSDTLIRAFIGCDSSIVVISQNGVVYATTFAANGTFASHMQVQSHGGKGIDITQSALPVAVQNYISTTYPNAVFEKAFQLMSATTITGFVVIVDANGTDYALEFDASGTFIKSRVIH